MISANVARSLGVPSDHFSKLQASYLATDLRDRKASDVAGSALADFVHFSSTDAMNRIGEKAMVELRQTPGTLGSNVADAVKMLPSHVTSRTMAKAVYPTALYTVWSCVPGPICRLLAQVGCDALTQAAHEHVPTRDKLKIARTMVNAVAAWPAVDSVRYRLAATALRGQSEQPTAAARLGALHAALEVMATEPVDDFRVALEAAEAKAPGRTNEAIDGERFGKLFRRFRPADEAQKSAAPFTAELSDYVRGLYTGH